MSVNDNIKFLENIRQGFKRTISFKNGNDDPARDYFDKYYTSLVEIKDSNALIDSKPFFDQPIKNKQEAYEKLHEMSRNDAYRTGDLLDYLYY